MRRAHFDALRPVCPVCRAAGLGEVPLALAAALREEDGHLVEGILHCTGPRCRREYPVVDGVPLLLPGLRGYVAGCLDQILAREDLAETTESLLGDCAGPGSAFDVARQHLSTYAWDHYADLDPDEAPADPGPGSVVRLLDRALALAGPLREGPVLDLGCAVGRTTLELAARTGRPVLGVDLGFGMLRLASRVLRRSEVAYPRRRVGVAYDRRRFRVSFPAAGRADFWACDATAPPLPAGAFAAVVALNVLDCVASPHDLLAALPRLLAPGGKALLATPYDWSPGATPLEAWLGGHSQRGPDHGAGEPVLRKLLSPGAHPAAVEGLKVVAEENALPWRVRLHDRSVMEYQVHLMVVASTVEDEPTLEHALMPRPRASA